jgi:ElaB/YqjD/DUF883 family membrane-anchored ribosome-binding protein
MENTKTQEQGNTSTGTAVKSAEDKTQNNQGSIGDAKSQQDGGNNKANGATEVVDQAKQAVTDVYNRASQSLNEGYTQAVDYSRENPGKTTLIALGAGIGIGLLLAGSLSSSRSSRTGRIVPPIMNALTEVAAAIFR